MPTFEPSPECLTFGGDDKIQPVHVAMGLWQLHQEHRHILRHHRGEPRDYLTAGHGLKSLGKLKAALGSRYVYPLLDYFRAFEPRRQLRLAIEAVWGMMRLPIESTMKCFLTFITAVIALPFFAQDALPTKAEIFEIEGHKAVLYAAPKPAEGKPWVWYAPTLNGGVSLAGRKMYFDAFTKAGISLAGFDLGEVRGAPASSAKFTLFYDAMVKRGFSTKPILLGQSRGGMMTLAWAFRHPGKVKAWVGIYPVCNLASWPLKNSKSQTLADFALPEAELVSRLKEFNPIDNLTGLAVNKVPMFAVHGDSDVVVPYDLNTKLLKERYEAAGGSCSVKIVPGEGHKVGPSFFECQELVDFVLGLK